MPSSSGWGRGDVQRVPAHVRDLQRGVGRLDQRHVAGDPAEPRARDVFEAALGHQLHADADAEERPAAAAHGLLQRLDHAGHGVEPGAAVGEGADARQHDAVGREHRVGIAGDDDRHRRRPASRAARSKRLVGRVQVARAVVDDGDGHRPPPASGNRPMTGWGRKAAAPDGMRAGAGSDRRPGPRRAAPALEEAALGASSSASAATTSTSRQAAARQRASS